MLRSITVTLKGTGAEPSVTSLTESGEDDGDDDDDDAD